MAKLIRFDLVNASLVRETEKAVLIKCEKYEMNKDVSVEQWFPKSKCKLVEGVWQVDKRFMWGLAKTNGYSLNSKEIWEQGI